MVFRTQHLGRATIQGPENDMPEPIEIAARPAATPRLATEDTRDNAGGAGLFPPPIPAPGR